MKYKIFLVVLILSNVSVKLNAQDADTVSRKIDTLSRKLDTLKSNLATVSSNLATVSSNLATVSRNLNASTRKNDSTLRLEDLELSSAPAFSLLDISPSSIQKPASTKALTTNIISNLRGGIPQNYALEVTPFWFFKHKKLNSIEYMGVNAKDTTDIKNRATSRARYFSVSLAVINRDTSINIGTLGNHNVSLGLRATLLKFYKKKDLNNIYNKNVAWLETLKAKQPGTLGGPPVRIFSKDDVEAIDKYQQETQAAVDDVRESLKALPVFSLDGAFATNMTFDNNSISSNRINRTGVWLNANFNFLWPASDEKKSYDNYIKLYVIGRYIHSKDSLDQQKKYINADLWDYGGRLELQFNRLSFGYEYIERTSSVEAFSSYRSVGLIQFKVSDNLFITGSFGKNFPRGNNIISALGVNWGISNGRERITRE